MGARRLVDREGEDLGDLGSCLLHGLAQIGLEQRQLVGVVALNDQAHRVCGVPGAGQGGPAGDADGLRDEVAPGSGRPAHGLQRPDPVAGQGQDRADSQDTVQAGRGAVDPSRAGQAPQVVDDKELAGPSGAGLSQGGTATGVVGAGGCQHREPQGAGAGAGVDDAQPLRASAPRARARAVGLVPVLGLELGRGDAGVVHGAGQGRGDVDGQDLYGPAGCAPVGVHQFLDTGPGGGGGFAVVSGDGVQRHHLDRALTQQGLRQAGGGVGDDGERHAAYLIGKPRTDRQGATAALQGGRQR